MSLLTQFLDAQLLIGGVPILWREIVGNLFGLAAAIGGMRRVVWAWPVGIVGNLLLLTVFLGSAFHTPQDVDLYGQAGRQIMFLAVGAYGWWRWSRDKKANAAARAADL
ncbi:MAG TPA: nicotinamide mononucleotide transporter, partial [Actinomycetales bacterium]|nr:nicotinamide mononucleotide transporter [Actinomycetales bacterium]